MDGDSLTRAEVFCALKVLFSSGAEGRGSLLETIQPADIKKAYRKKALLTHPDRYADRDERFQKACSRRFIEVNNAYATLTSYVKLREEQGFRFDPEEVGRPSPRCPKRSPQPRPAKPAAPRKPAANHSRAAFFWHKVLPQKPLRIAEFLFYTGVIPWNLLIKAIVWQRAQRPSLGEIAQKWRWLSESQIKLLLRNRRPGERLGEALVRFGLITSFQLRVLLAQQRRMQQPIGNFFVRNGHLSEAQFERYLQRQRMHNRKYTRDFAAAFNTW